MFAEGIKDISPSKAIERKPQQGYREKVVKTSCLKVSDQFFSDLYSFF